MNKRICLLASVFLLGTSPSHALESLEVHIQASKGKNRDLQEARAIRGQRAAETDTAWWKLAPTFSATGTLARNQYASSIRLPTEAGSEPRTVVITPENQRDLTLLLTLPLIDVGAWERIRTARLSETAAKEREGETALNVELSVARSWYSVVAAESVLASSQRQVDAASKNLLLAQQRARAGVAMDLDLRRAEAEVARAKQVVADAESQLAQSRRALGTVSGREASLGAPPLEADTRGLLPLSRYDGSIESQPGIRAALAEVGVARASVRSTFAALYPTLTLLAQERFTNATGFGQEPYYTVSLSLGLRLDPSVFSSAATQRTQVTLSQIRFDRSRQDLRDQIFNAYKDTEAQIAKARAADVEAEASRLAAKLAAQRYAAGTATIFELTVADRDAFTAELRRVEALANLAYARFALAKKSGLARDGRNSP